MLMIISSPVLQLWFMPVDDIIRTDESAYANINSKKFLNAQRQII